ncbi:MAG: hypothetical protein K0R45_1876, partial [Pseudomonas sp.]|nr:hypothetical protein [Pseudomonas sp.]
MLNELASVYESEGDSATLSENVF